MRILPAIDVEFLGNWQMVVLDNYLILALTAIIRHTRRRKLRNPMPSQLRPVNGLEAFTIWAGSVDAVASRGCASSKTLHVTLTLFENTAELNHALNQLFRRQFRTKSFLSTNPLP